MIRTEISQFPIAFSALDAEASVEGSGALATFIGVARASSSTHAGRVVMRLEYEAYVPMASRELRAIADECVSTFGALRCTAIHRIGVLEIGDIAVAIAVWTAHRAEAFGGCRYIIEEIKKRIPIWKREVFIDGTAWADGYP